MTGVTSENWRDFANCASTDPEVFHVEKGGSTKAAKTVCARCPLAVREHCLAFALDHEHADWMRFGVWGGLSPAERSRLVHGQPAEATHPPARRSDAQVGRIRALAAAGWTDRQIAVEVGLVRDTVCRVRARHGIRPGWTARRLSQGVLDFDGAA